MLLFFESIHPVVPTIVRQHSLANVKMQTIYKLSNFEWISRPPIEVDNIMYIVWRSYEVAMTIESWANLTKSQLATKYYGNYISLHLGQICVILRNGIDVIIAIRWTILNVWIECLARITLSTLCYVYTSRKLWCDVSCVYYVAHRLCVLVVETIGTVCIDWFFGSASVAMRKRGQLIQQALVHCFDWMHCVRPHI